MPSEDNAHISFPQLKNPTFDIGEKGSTQPYAILRRMVSGFQVNLLKSFIFPSGSSD